MPEAQATDLWYGDVFVGHIRNPFLSDGTWFGILELTTGPGSGELARRLLEYIQFCENWNERARKGSADVAEFEPYFDLVKSGLWAIRDSAGRSTLIADAPVFFVDHEITWTLV